MFGEALGELRAGTYKLLFQASHSLSLCFVVAIFLCVFSKRRSNPSPRVVNMLCATQPDATALTKQVEQLRCDYLHTVVHKILQLRTLQ